MYYTYILKCENGNFYTGITTDVNRRFDEHTGKRKSGAKYTRANVPVAIVAVWSSEDRSRALKLETFIKSLKRQSKIDLISSPCILNDKYCEKINATDYTFVSSLVSIK